MRRFGFGMLGSVGGGVFVASKNWQAFRLDDSVTDRTLSIRSIQTPCIARERVWIISGCWFTSERTGAQADPNIEAGAGARADASIEVGAAAHADAKIEVGTGAQRTLTSRLAPAHQSRLGTGLRSAALQG